ncbi:MAG: response regulator [Gammaproteobacteria bacterium]|nr:response regulator [Gammaproteobacteria bacterium]MBU1415776.1 response regulator [Gammaproteobacteria bacterium]
MTEAANKPHPPASTVFVVDDDDGMRNALRRALMQAGFAVQPFASGQAFLDGYRPAPPACLLLDVKMPEMSGLEVQTVLNERLIDLPVIFLTGAAEVPIAVAAMKAGAVDFLEKPFDNEVLVARVRQCIATQAQRSQTAEDDGRYARGLALLTPREAEVMQLMLTGKTSKLIARSLGVSHRTIEIHRGRVMEKMQAETLAELVRMELSGRIEPRRG